jgi:uncharacterized protein (TIGR03663 family)
MAVGPRTDGRARRWGVAGVLAVVLAALVVRLVDLGARVAHWDEGRVAFWILDYAETGSFSYRPIIHGPFFHHVTPLLFDLFGTTDATLRLAPALLTGLLPLSVLLLRDRLDPLEQVGVAFFLAFNPILLYYGRFLRGDPAVGAFMFAAFVLFVRFVGTRRYRHLFAGVVLAALGFTVKENAPVYVLCWLGGLTVYGYLRLFAAKTAGDDPVRTWLGRRRDRLAAVDWSGPPRADGGAEATGRGATAEPVRPRELAARALFGLGVLAACGLLFLVVIVYFYAPRGATGVTVSTTLADPTMLPALVEEATLGSFDSFMDIWINSEKTGHAYLPYLSHLAGVVGAGALVVALLAVVGFALDSVRAGGPRPVVLVAFLWGGASLLGYPIITDIKAPWAAVHVVLPWTIPAGVALGALGRWARAAYASDDALGTAVPVAVVVSLLVAGSFVPLLGVPATLPTAYQTSFAAPQSESNELVQYAQPAAEIHPEIVAIERLAERNEGTDVVLYGRPLVEGQSIYQRPSCAGNDGWFESLPLPWYLERADAETRCAQDLGSLNAVEGEGRPPVVITTLDRRDALAERYPGYTVTVREMRVYGSERVFFIDSSRLPADRNPLAGVETTTAVGDEPSGATDGPSTEATTAATANAVTTPFEPDASTGTTLPVTTNASTATNASARTVDGVATPGGSASASSGGPAGAAATPVRIRYG